MFYDEIYRVCKEKGTTPTAVLKEAGLSTGNISRWKQGSSPTVDAAIKLASVLGVSLSYLCNPSDITARRYSADVDAWLDIIERIPPEKQSICMDFLRTHAVSRDAPPKFVGKITA